MRGKFITITLAAMLSMLLTGCFSWSAEESYKLPQPPQAYQNLTNAVNQTKRALAAEYSTTVEDVPPSAGDNTSTVQLLDMDADGSQETAVSFLRVVGAENPIRICFYTLQAEDGYVASSVVEGAGDGVYAVHYADVDGRTDAAGRLCKEVVVSWQMGNEAYYLGVYSLDDSDEQSLVTTTYDGYRLLDLDEDGRMELAVARLDPEQKLGEVVVYDWQDEREPVQQRISLSAGLSAVRQVRAGVLANMVPALYISSDLADGRRVTDVLAVNKRGELANLSLDGESGISREVCDPYRDLAPTDVNGDGVPEVARPRQLNSYGTSVGAWLTDWVQYTRDGRVKAVCTTYHNTADGWYLVVPQHWQSRLILSRHDSMSGQRAVNFSLWQGEDKDPLTFLTVYKLTGSSRSLRANTGSRFVLAEDGSAVYAAAFYSGWNCGVDQNGLLENFRLIVSSWSGD
ncbi:MAG: hypothetical protein J6R39_00895 [Oscillospiraceae bacterium]|nr:hypothetical protein [Oscillospiraceae bacterium]